MREYFRPIPRLLMVSSTVGLSILLNFGPDPKAIEAGPPSPTPTPFSAPSNPNIIILRPDIVRPEIVKPEVVRVPEIQIQKVEVPVFPTPNPDVISLHKRDFDDLVEKRAAKIAEPIIQKAEADVKAADAARQKAEIAQQKAELEAKVAQESVKTGQRFSWRDAIVGGMVTVVVLSIGVALGRRRIVEYIHTHFPPPIGP